jgi:hypothetical protein
MPAAESSALLTTITTSGMAVAIINWLKGSKYFPWITKEKTWLLRGLSLVAATASSFGIHYAWNASDHSLLITGLTLSSVLPALFALSKSLVVNEWIFRSTKPQSNPAVVAAVAPAAAVEAGIIPPGYPVAESKQGIIPEKKP